MNDINDDTPEAAKFVPKAAERVPLDAKVTITILPENMIANMSISAPKYGGRPLDADMIRRELTANNITSGIDEEKIDQLAKTPLYDTDIIIAKGVSPIDGEDAEIIFYINKETSIKPAERSDGSVDYHDLGLIQNVNEGQLLAEKKPATDGVEGYDVFSTQLKPKQGRNVNLPVGMNTKVSEDGLSLRATKSGHVEYINGKITVEDTFTIKGDVSAATGNIKFNGDVVVSGSVLSGFKVTATRNITIMGGCEGATINAGGNIVIGEGVNGGKIEASGEIKSKYLQSAEIMSGGNVYAGAIINCNLKSGGSVIVSGQKAVITGGSCSANKLIDTAFIGSKSATVRTHIEVGLNPMLQIRMNAAPKELAETRKTQQSLERVVELFKQLEAAGRLDEYKAEKLQNAEYTLETVKQRISELELEIKEIEEQSHSLGFGTIIARGIINHDVKLVIGPCQMEVDNPISNARITRGTETLIIGKAIGH